MTLGSITGSLSPWEGYFRENLTTPNPSQGATDASAYEDHFEEMASSRPASPLLMNPNLSQVHAELMHIGSYRDLGHSEVRAYAQHPLTLLVQELHRTYLHEDDPEVGFYKRKGAFSYEEVAGYCFENMIKLYQLKTLIPSVEDLIRSNRVDSRSIAFCQERAPSVDMRAFLVRNVEFLKRELDHLETTHEEQICTFRGLLIDFAYTKEIFKKERHLNLVELHCNRLLRILRQLEKELRVSDQKIQDRTAELQPFMAASRKLKLGQYHQLPLKDLDGKSFVLKDPQADPAKEYGLVYKFYADYFEDVLEPNLDYCTKFLTAINLCRTEVLAYKESVMPGS